MDRRTGFEPASSSITLLNVRSVGGYRRILFGASSLNQTDIFFLRMEGLYSLSY